MRKQANTAQKVKFSIEDFFSKCDQIWSHLLKKSLIEKTLFFLQCNFRDLWTTFFSNNLIS